MTTPAPTIPEPLVEQAAQIAADEFGLLSPGPEEFNLARAMLAPFAERLGKLTDDVDPRAYIEAHRDEGVACPTCGQFCKLYRRRVNKGMVLGLVALASTADNGTFVHAPSVEGLSRLGGEMARLALWDLIEEETRVREDGGRAGWWRITQEGREFLSGRRKITKFALIYLGQHEGFDGPAVDVHDAYGQGFDLQALMRGE